MVAAALDPLGVPLGTAQVSFGTDGIRGRVGTFLTPALALQVGYWCGQVLPEAGPLLIGMDSRTSGAMVASALTAGLTAAGREVWNLGLCPTPAVPGLIRKLGAAGGLMVSASHNPPEDNGIKVFAADGVKLSSEQQALIEAGLRGEGIGGADQPLITSCGPAYQRDQLLSHYRDSLLASVQHQRLDGVPIVLDLCWGSATACGAEVFAALGADLTVLHGEPDGMRINVGCGSTQLEPLRRAVIERGASMGFAFDGDADRMLALDGQGRVVDGDHVLYLWGSVLQDQQALPQQRLVATVMSNLGFERAWQARGGVLERTPVGDQHVYAAMVANSAALGGEQSGHILS
ncbi:MAG: phosphoglucosamine mutase, partial [Prochlorococcus sp.]